MAFVWDFLHKGCDKLSIEGLGFTSGSNGGGNGGGSSRTKKHGHGHKQRRGSVVAGGGQSIHAMKDAWALQRGGAAAFESVMLSWTRLLMWRMNLCDGERLPAGNPLNACPDLQANPDSSRLVCWPSPNARQLRG